MSPHNTNKKSCPLIDAEIAEAENQMSANSGGTTNPRRSEMLMEKIETKTTFSGSTFDLAYQLYQQSIAAQNHAEEAIYRPALDKYDLLKESPNSSADEVKRASKAANEAEQQMEVFYDARNHAAQKVLVTSASRLDDIHKKNKLIKNECLQADLSPEVFEVMDQDLDKVFMGPENDRHAAWKEAMQKFQDVQQKHGDYEKIWNAAYETHQANEPSFDLIDWESGAFQFMNKHDVAFRLDVEKHWQDFLAGENKIWWAADPEKRKARVRAALDSVLEYRNLREKNDQQSGFYKIDADYNVVLDELSAAESTLIKTGAPDAAALHQKLALLYGPKACQDENENSTPCWTQDYTNALIADAEFLATQ